MLLGSRFVYSLDTEGKLLLCTRGVGNVEVVSM